MASLIESLIGTGIKRPDNKRILPTRRPLPTRPRDLLELLVSLGQQATFPAILQSCDLRQADQRHMTFIALGRWPTLDELDRIPTPYDLRTHLRGLLLGEEFRANLIRRLCDAYPERPRLFHVQIPRCAGDHFLRMADAMHPVFPAALGTWRRNDQAFIPGLGSYLGRFNLTRTILITLPTLQPFIQTAPDLPADAALRWSIMPPPRRAGDRLFTIVREPTGLILSQVNAILAGLADSALPDASLAAWRAQLGRLPPAADSDGWRAVGRTVLARLQGRDPICHALGTGTARSAAQACRVSDIEIADLGHYADWVKYTWDVEPEPASNAAPRVLSRSDLDAAETAHLEGLVSEDLAFYAPMAALFGALTELKTTVRGRDL